MSTKEAVEADSIMFRPVADVVMLLYLGSRMFGLMLLSFVSLISLIDFVDIVAVAEIVTPTNSRRISVHFAPKQLVQLKAVPKETTVRR